MLGHFFETRTTQGDAKHWKSAPAITAALAHHQTGIRQWERNEDILTSGFEAGTSENEGIAPFPFRWRATGIEVPFLNGIMCNFMVYQDRLEANLFQLFANPENSERFSIISVFFINVVGEQKQEQLVRFFVVVYTFPSTSTLLLFALRYRCSGVPVLKWTAKKVAWGVLSGAKKYVLIVFIKVSRFQTFLGYLFSLRRMFSVNLKQDLTIVISLVVYNHFITYLPCIYPRHGGGGRGITRKSRNHEVPQRIREDLIATQRQYWRKGDTETRHQQLLQLFTVIQVREIVEEKWRFVRSIRPSKHGRPQKFFQGGGQSRHFAYPFQVVDDATQMDVHKTLHPFYTTKKIPNATATVAYKVYALQKFTLRKCLFLLSIDILRVT